jgi:hypothetical protein
MNRMTRRSAISKTAALLAVSTAAASASTSHETPIASTCNWAVIRHEHRGDLTWVALCPNMEAWEKLTTNNHLLKSLNTVRFHSCVVATRVIDLIEVLKSFGAPDFNGRLWDGVRDTDAVETLRTQWEWLNSPFAQSILNR